MAKLHESQGKKLLAQNGIKIPRGAIAETPEDVRAAAEKINKPVVVKAQVHGTSRAAAGGVRFAQNGDEAFAAAREIFANGVAGIKVETVVVDERIDAAQEFYLGFIVDDHLKRPLLLLNLTGGSGIEERAAGLRSLPCSARREPAFQDVLNFVREAGASVDLQTGLAQVLLKLYRTARGCEARVAEINPLAATKGGELVALDCRISVDDYAVFRHPELNVEIARELGHEPTPRERIAWEIERDDFRGTFYFVEILDSDQWSAVSSQKEAAANSEAEIQNPKSKIQNRTADRRPLTSDCCLIGFHGAGGGGSMASLDAAQRSGLQPACYVDTSGNPPASKVYRAARIILSLPDIRGYFLSGSGVASQEQFVLARAVVKAFLEVQPQIPAVLRLGGNGEEIAKEIVEKYRRYLPAPVEAYQKNDSADFCAARLRNLIENPPSRQAAKEIAKDNEQRTTNDFYNFKTRTGRVFYDHAALVGHDTTGMIESCPTRILSENERGLPVLNISEAEAERGKCVECLACEFAAWEILGVGRGAKIEFPIPDLNPKSEIRNPKSKDGDFD